MVLDEQQPDRSIIKLPILGSRGLLNIGRRLDADIRVMTLPRGKDPDELLLSDATTWNRLLEESVPVADHYINVVTGSVDLRSARGKRDAVTQLAPLIRAIGDPVERAHYMQKLATLTQSPLLIIEQAVARARSTAPAAPARGSEPPHPGAPTSAGSTVPGSATALNQEDHLLSLLVRYPQALALPGVPPATRWVRSENRLIAEALEAAGAEAGDAAPEAVSESARTRLDPELQEHFDALLARAEAEPRVQTYKLQTELHRRVQRLDEFNDRLWLQQCEFMIQEAITNGDTDTIQRLLPILDQKRPQFLAYAPAKSTVFRDSRDPNPV
jgi:DNA primase